MPNVARTRERRPKLRSGLHRAPNPQIATRSRDLALISSHPHRRPQLRLLLRREREISEKKLRKLCDRSAELGNAREIVTGRSKQIYNRRRQLALTLRHPFHRTGQGGGASADVPAGSRLYLRLAATELLRLGNVGRDPPRLIVAQQLGRKCVVGDPSWPLKIGRLLLRRARIAGIRRSAHRSRGDRERCGLTSCVCRTWDRMDVP